ncbi:MAG: hypothetical protein H6672_16990 [Anaerolineaceae bacterium]|nr:hypothetical protein [Anaerolineaceae bacterium]
MSPEIIFAFLVLFIVYLVLQARHEMRLDKAARTFSEQLQAAADNLLELKYPLGRAQLEQPGYPPAQRRRQAVLEVTTRTVAVHWRSLEMNEAITFLPDDLRWFGRPHKYTSGDNEIWLHFEHGETWWLLKIRLGREAMRLFVRALKAASSPELVTAYRRRRPYVHLGPLVALPATQDLQGAWHLEDAVALYLMPRYLVIMRGMKVARVIALEAMSEIGALRRLDAPGADGLVRFRAEQEPFAFALKRYEPFADSLAQSARLTLEDPVERKRKKQDDDDAYEWDE